MRSSACRCGSWRGIALPCVHAYVCQFGTISSKRMLQTAKGVVPEFVASTQKVLFGHKSM